MWLPYGMRLSFSPVEIIPFDGDSLTSFNLEEMNSRASSFQPKRNSLQAVFKKTKEERSTRASQAEREFLLLPGEACLLIGYQTGRPSFGSLPTSPVDFMIAADQERES